MTTVTRKQYGTEVDNTWTSNDTGTTKLGLEYTTATKEFEGSVTVGNVSIEDAFEIESVEISNTPGTGLVSLAADIAEVQSQERCIPELTGSLTVPGFAMDEDLTAHLDTEGSATIEPEESVELATALGRSHVYCYPLSKKVSYMGTLSGISVLCDRRRSMAGYGVEGAAEVCWVPLPYSYWKGLPEETRTLIAKELEIAALMGGDTHEVIAVSDGVIAKEDALASDSSRVFFDANSKGSTRQFADVDVEGVGYVLWPDNKSYVIGILAAVPRVNMQSVIGLAAVCVGIGGSVPGWMVSANKAYGIPFANLVKAYGIDKEIKKSFDGTGRWLVGDGSAYIDTGVTSYTDMRVTLDIKAPSTIETSNGIIGGAWATNAFFLMWYTNGCLRFHFGASSGFNSAALAASSTHHVELSSCTMKVDDTTYTGTSSSQTVGQSIHLFRALSNTGTKAGMNNVAFYDTNSDTLHFFIPMLKDSVNGMYDLIGQQFYANANSSGTFTIE